LDSDVVVIGAGVLGVTTAYWLTQLYDCSVLVVDREREVATQTTARNTGLVHRPYYLDSAKRRVAALTAERSYHLWKKLALQFGLPWKEAGTLMVATEEKQIKALESYERWGVENGMSEDEYELQSREEVTRLEPEVRCEAAILSKRDTSTDYAALTRKVWEIASERGARFLGGSEVAGVEDKGQGLKVGLRDGRSIGGKLLINAAGGYALDVARMMGLGEAYSLLHFRGEYWVVDDSRAPRVSRNIYSVARHKEFPFLDPHFIVRASGRREVGPNAVLVAAPDSYHGVGGGLKLFGGLAERPLGPKVRLFTNVRFLSLVWDEWQSSMSKGSMCGRVRGFVPSLEPKMLVERGLAGVRSNLIGADGFIPEPVMLEGEDSVHVLNYNSPGATGAPAFSLRLVRRLQARGFLDGVAERGHVDGLWDPDAAEIE